MMIFQAINRKHRTLFTGMLLALTACGMFLVQAGCSTPPHLKQYSRSEADFSGIRKVAVFPFESLTPDEFAGERIRRLVISELLDRGYEVIEPGEVASVLATVTGYKQISLINKEDIRKTAKALGVDAVFMGAVETYRMSSGMTAQYADVSISIRLLGAANGEILWSVAHTSGGPTYWMRHFGSEGLTLSEAARKVVHEAVAQLP